MLLQEDLYRCGIEPSILNRTTDRSMGDNANALRSGNVDVVQVFEPYVDDLVAPGHGYVWHRAAVRGDVAFTSFYTTRHFTEESRETCIRLVRGINMALTSVQNLPAKDVASAVAAFSRTGQRRHSSGSSKIIELRIFGLGDRSSQLTALFD